MPMMGMPQPGYIAPPIPEEAPLPIEVEAEPIRGNSEAEEKATQKCKEWYEVDRNAKKPYISEFKEAYKLYKGEHWDLIGESGDPLRSSTQKKNRPNVVENISWALVEGVVAEFAQDVELLDYPVEKNDDMAAKVMTDLKKFIWNKNRLINERPKFLRWFFTYGTGIFHVYWDPDWRGGKGPNRWVGDIRWKALHPLCLVPDARCKEDINEGNRCHKVIWHTMESIEEMYPERAHIVQEQTMDNDDYLDQAEDMDGYSYGDTKARQVPIIETWYIGKPLILGEGEEDEGTGLHVIWWAGEDQGVYLKHVNYMYFDPGETPQFPFFVKQCYPRENSIWGFGELYYLKNPQIVRNKTAEMIMEGHLYSSRGRTYYNMNAMTKKQEEIIKKYGTNPYMWFAMRDIQGIKTEYGQPVPGSLHNEMSRNQSLMETLIGRFDISQGRTPGSVTAFRAIAELSARAQVRLQTKEQSITSAYQEVGAYINRLISLYYTEQRMYRIMGDKDGQVQYGIYNQPDMLKVYNFATGMAAPLNNAEQTLNEEQWKAFELQSMEFGTGLNEFMLNNPDFEVYSPDFDVRCEVTSITPADRIYNMEIAKELMVSQIIDPETFLEVMAKGRFGPVDIILQRIQEQKLQQMQMQMMQPGAGSAGGNPTAQPGSVGGMPPVVDMSQQVGGGY